MCCYNCLGIVDLFGGGGGGQRDTLESESDGHNGRNGGRQKKPKMKTERGVCSTSVRRS